MQEKLFIKNRKEQKIAVLVDIAEKQKGIAFVMHGLGGFKEQPHIELYSQVFLDNGYTTVRFDTTDTFGESDGNYEDATVTNYYEDLEDVIAWSKDQEWYQEPFCLIGHSLGSMCLVLYAEKFPQKVQALAPTSTVISGSLSSASDRHKKIADEWKRTGWRIEESESKPGFLKKLKWSHMEDRLKHDILPMANNLSMPVLLIVGENDTATPLEHQQIFYNKLPGKKELHVIKGSSHNFRSKEHLNEVRNILNKWVQKL